ncbi:MAG: gamma-glutamyltransferase [Gammaproteobacteria bacterium]
MKPDLARYLAAALVCVVGLLAACSDDDAATGQGGAPPSSTLAKDAGHLVVAAHPAAVEAGLEILRAGGNAADAAVAVQMALGVIEVPETGLGGGAFLLYYDSASGQLSFHDGRETAPAAAQRQRFTWFGGRAVAHPLAVISGRAVGVPGLVAMFASAHATHGRLDWAALLAPAIRLAEEGLEMPPRLAAQLRGDPSLRLFGDLRESVLSDLAASPPRLQDSELAATLRVLAADGPGAFYNGAIPAAVVARARDRWLWPSDLTVADFLAYRAQRREPVCGHYHAWRICGAAPPSSGGIAVLQILGMLEAFPMASLADDRAAAMHLIAEASRLAFADRAHYVGDPDFIDVPVAALLDREYLRARAALIEPGRVMTTIAAGRADLRGEGGPNPAWQAPPDRSGGTSHFTVIDGAGNIAAVTSSIEAPFGSRMRAAGFLLNNQLTDFDFVPPARDGAVPNLPAAGKRPRSSMSPVIVFATNGKPVLALGARGGSRIIGHVVRVLVAVLDWELPLAAAIAEANFVHRGHGLELERGSAAAAHREALRGWGHEVRVERMPSGLHGIEWTAEGWRGAADPRQDGIAGAE